MKLLTVFFIGVILHQSLADDANSETLDEISAYTDSVPELIVPYKSQTVGLAKNVYCMTVQPTAISPPTIKKKLKTTKPPLTKGKRKYSGPPKILRPLKMVVETTTPSMVIPPIAPKLELDTTTASLASVKLGATAPPATMSSIETPPMIKEELESTIPPMIIGAAEIGLETTTPPVGLSDLGTTTLPAIIEPPALNFEIERTTPSMTKAETTITSMIPETASDLGTTTPPVINQPTALSVELETATAPITKMELETTIPSMSIQAEEIELETTAAFVTEIVLETTLPPATMSQLEPTTAAMMIQPTALELDLETLITMGELETITPPPAIRKEQETTVPSMAIQEKALNIALEATTPTIIDPKTDPLPLVVVQPSLLTPPQPPLNPTTLPPIITTILTPTVTNPILADKPKKLRKYPKYRFKTKRRRKTTKRPSYTTTTKSTVETYLPASSIDKPSIDVIEPMPHMPLTGGHFFNYRIKS